MNKLKPKHKNPKFQFLCLLFLFQSDHHPEKLFVLLAHLYQLNLIIIKLFLDDDNHRMRNVYKRNGASRIAYKIILYEKKKEQFLRNIFFYLGLNRWIYVSNTLVKLLKMLTIYSTITNEIFYNFIFSKTKNFHDETSLITRRTTCVCFFLYVKH